MYLFFRVVTERCAHDCITLSAKRVLAVTATHHRQRARERRQHQVDNLYVINGEASNAYIHTHSYRNNSHVAMQRAKFKVVQQSSLQTLYRHDCSVIALTISQT
jgi:hypothetical protein